jgi:hypothetical protein
VTIPFTSYKNGHLDSELDLRMKEWRNVIVIRKILDELSISSRHLL